MMDSIDIAQFNDGIAQTPPIEKATRFSQLDEEQAAKLYAERYRQIESDMLKKLQQKRVGNHQSSNNHSNGKKTMNFTVPRSNSSSSNTFASPSSISNQLFQQQHQQIHFAGMNSMKSSQVISKINAQQMQQQHQQNQQHLLSQGSPSKATLTQPSYLAQSTTLTGTSRISTEENTSITTEQQFNTYMQQQLYNQQQHNQQQTQHQLGGYSSKQQLSNLQQQQQQQQQQQSYLLQSQLSSRSNNQQLLKQSQLSQQQQAASSPSSYLSQQQQYLYHNESSPTSNNNGVLQHPALTIPTSLTSQGIPDVRHVSSPQNKRKPTTVITQQQSNTHSYAATKRVETSPAPASSRVHSVATAAFSGFYSPKSRRISATSNENLKLHSGGGTTTTTAQLITTAAQTTTANSLTANKGLRKIESNLSSNSNTSLALVTQLNSNSNTNNVNKQQGSIHFGFPSPANAQVSSYLLQANLKQTVNYQLGSTTIQPHKSVSSHTSSSTTTTTTMTALPKSMKNNNNSNTTPNTSSGAAINGSQATITGTTTTGVTSQEIEDLYAKILSIQPDLIAKKSNSNTSTQDPSEQKFTSESSNKKHLKTQPAPTTASARLNTNQNATASSQTSTKILRKPSRNPTAVNGNPITTTKTPQTDQIKDSSSVSSQNSQNNTPRSITKSQKKHEQLIKSFAKVSQAVITSVSPTGALKKSVNFFGDHINQIQSATSATHTATPEKFRESESPYRVLSSRFISDAVIMQNGPSSSTTSTQTTTATATITTAQQNLSKKQNSNPSTNAVSEFNAVGATSGTSQQVDDFGETQEFQYLESIVNAQTTTTTMNTQRIKSINPNAAVGLVITSSAQSPTKLTLINKKRTFQVPSSVRISPMKNSYGANTIAANSSNSKLSSASVDSSPLPLGGALDSARNRPGAKLRSSDIIQKQQKSNTTPSQGVNQAAVTPSTTVQNLVDQNSNDTHESNQQQQQQLFTSAVTMTNSTPVQMQMSSCLKKHPTLAQNYSSRELTNYANLGSNTTTHKNQLASQSSAYLTSSGYFGSATAPLSLASLNSLSNNNSARQVSNSNQPRQQQQQVAQNQQTSSTASSTTNKNAPTTTLFSQKVFETKQQNYGKSIRFSDAPEEDDDQLEEISKNIHKKLNQLLENANQCNENLKSIREQQMHSQQSNAFAQSHQQNGNNN